MPPRLSIRVLTTRFFALATPCTYLSCPKPRHSASSKCDGICKRSSEPAYNLGTRSYRFQCNESLPGRNSKINSPLFNVSYMSSPHAVSCEILKPPELRGWPLSVAARTSPIITSRLIDPSTLDHFAQADLLHIHSGTRHKFACCAIGASFKNLGRPSRTRANLKLHVQAAHVPKVGLTTIRLLNAKTGVSSP